MSAKEKLVAAGLGLMRIAAVTRLVHMVLGVFGEDCCMCLDLQ